MDGDSPHGAVRYARRGTQNPSPDLALTIPALTPEDPDAVLASKYIKLYPDERILLLNRSGTAFLLRLKKPIPRAQFSRSRGVGRWRTSAWEIPLI